jgi:hypothetical protein
MPLCGFNPKMIQGIAIFAEGLFEATVARAREEGKSLPEAFDIELRDIRLFLQAIEDKHQELKRKMPPAEAAAGVADLVYKWRDSEQR